MDPIEKAVQILRHDGVVIYPTDTVYGLGGDAFSDEAILKVYEAKHRPVSQPISIAVSSIEMLYCVAWLDDIARAFIARFFPGPVTLVLPARNSVPEILTGGTGMIGIRFPAHPLALRLIDGMDSPITATSANIHGGREPATPDECHVHHNFLIDGGRLPGTPSTVVDIGNRTILRHGAGADDVLAFLGQL